MFVSFTEFLTNRIVRYWLEWMLRVQFNTGNYHLWTTVNVNYTKCQTDDSNTLL